MAIAWWCAAPTGTSHVREKAGMRPAALHRPARVVHSRQSMSTNVDPVARTRFNEPPMTEPKMSKSDSIRQRFAVPAVAAMVALAALGFFQLHAGAAEEAVVIPPPSIDEKPSAALEKAVFAGGCFWGVQGVFQHVKGVENAVSGYSGGDKETAHYNMVGTGQTGHAEAVEVTYDPSKVTYGQLLQVYFSVAHNPTQLNYQGPDRGTQYRSAISWAGGRAGEDAGPYIAELDKA